MDYNKKVPLWQWIIIYLLVGGLIYALIYYIFLKPQYTAQPAAIPSITPTISATTTPTSKISPTTTNPSTEFTVTAKSSGFDPQTLSIKSGETIVWVNADTNNIYLASDPHPSHTDYPALNLGIVKPGESVSLMFPTAGTYKYHDHLNPSHRGTIIVK